MKQDWSSSQKNENRDHKDRRNERQRQRQKDRENSNLVAGNLETEQKGEENQMKIA